MCCRIIDLACFRVFGCVKLSSSTVKQPRPSQSLTYATHEGTQRKKENKSHRFLFLSPLLGSLSPFSVRDWGFSAGLLTLYFLGVSKLGLLSVRAAGTSISGGLCSSLSERHVSSLSHWVSAGQCQSAAVGFELENSRCRDVSWSFRPWKVLLKYFPHEKISVLSVTEAFVRKRFA